MSEASRSGADRQCDEPSLAVELARVEVVPPGVDLAVVDLEGPPMTCRSKVLSASVKTSTRSVITTGPLAAMLMTRNSMRSMPGGQGRMNEAMLSAMFSLPVTGSNGMLWYTASSVKNAPRSSAPRSLAHAAQNLLTRSIGFSICLLLRS